MLTTHLVLFSFYDGASNGVAPPNFAGFTTIPPTLAFFTGFNDGGTPTPPTPTPTPLPESSGGGPSQPLRDWRWYEGQELRPNWYQYPEERKKLRRAITRAVKRKEKAQKELKRPQQYDPAQTVAKLQEVQDQLSYLLSAYAQMTGLLRARDEEDDEARELIEILLDEL